MLQCDAGVAARVHRDPLSSSSSRARRRRSDLERIVDLADRLSPVLDALTRANRVQRTVAINERVA